MIVVIIIIVFVFIVILRCALQIRLALSYLRSAGIKGVCATHTDLEFIVCRRWP